MQVSTCWKYKIWVPRHFQPGFSNRTFPTSLIREFSANQRNFFYRNIRNNAKNLSVQKFAMKEAQIFWYAENSNRKTQTDFRASFSIFRILEKEFLKKPKTKVLSYELRNKNVRKFFQKVQNRFFQPARVFWFEFSAYRKERVHFENPVFGGFYIINWSK